MRHLRVVLLVVCMIVVCGSAATASVGRINILAEVHGYSAGGHTLVPMRGIAEWLGAQVSYSAPNISIKLGGTDVQLTVGSRQARVNGRAVQMSAPATVYGGVTCVPLRFVAESLGLQVSYHSGNDPEAFKTADIPVVILKGRGQSARVLVHQEPPNIVAKVIADLENSTQIERYVDGGEPFRIGRYGTDFILQVTKIHDGYFLSTVPAEWGPSAYEDAGDQPIFEYHAMAVYGYRGGRWTYLMGMQDVPSYNMWVNVLKIPVSVARKLGLHLEHY